MIIKVCGINQSENLQQIDNLNIDMIGINFYPKSKRYFHHDINLEKTVLSLNKKKVGVFVNSAFENLKQISLKYKLDFVQLHGDEDLNYCQKVKEFISVIKVIRVQESFDFSLLHSFQFVDYFLFDTYCKEYGGSGIRFDWSLLNQYTCNTPFIISGGITPKHTQDLLEIDHPQFYGIDINSRFEITPGIKDIKQVASFADKIKSKS